VLQLFCNKVGILTRGAEGAKPKFPINVKWGTSDLVIYAPIHSQVHGHMISYIETVSCQMQELAPL